jgi:putative Ca2+/H+ antiporter (TMEM165/GDT1 family)
MTVSLTSTAIVFQAETGDKTQLLAMAFATRFRWKTVKRSQSWQRPRIIFFAARIGNYLRHGIHFQCVMISAAASFFFFGF